MGWELITVDEKGIGSYSSNSVFLSSYHTPESVVEEVKRKFKLTDGNGIDDKYIPVVLH
jgi:hypothetical protein